MNGAKIMTMKACGIPFIDSYNLMPSALSKLPKAFGLTETKKGHFPHLFNTTENQKYMGPYPPLETYLPDGMKPDSSGRTREMVRSESGLGRDVRFRTGHVRILSIRRTHLAPMLRTISTDHQRPGKSRSVRRSHHVCECCQLSVPSQLHARTESCHHPHGRYQPERKYSVKALRWLKWIAHETNHDIRHARNGGEVRIGRYSVDGYNMNNQTLYEFYGCFGTGVPMLSQFETGRTSRTSRLYLRRSERSHTQSTDVLERTLFQRGNHLGTRFRSQVPKRTKRSEISFEGLTTT